MLLCVRNVTILCYLLFVLFHFYETFRLDNRLCVPSVPFTVPIQQNIGETMAPKQNDYAVYD